MCAESHANEVSIRIKPHNNSKNGTPGVQNYLVIAENMFQKLL